MTHPRNAQYQATWRLRRANEHSAWVKKVSELEEEVRQLKRADRDEILRKTPEAYAPEFPEYPRGRSAGDIAAVTVGKWLESELLAGRLLPDVLPIIARKCLYLAQQYVSRRSHERLKAPRDLTQTDIENIERHIESATKTAKRALDQEVLRKTPEAQTHYDKDTVTPPRPKKTLSPETKAKMKAGRERARELSAKIKAANEKEREFEKTLGRKLKKVEAMAADQRGDANVRAVAEDMAAKLRQSKPPPNPYRPPPLPSSLAEWDELKRKVQEERRAKRAAATRSK